EDRFVPRHAAVDRFAVRIEKKLRRIAALAGVRIPGAVDAVAVRLAGADVRQIAVPDVARHFGKVDAVLRAALIEEAQLDALGGLGKNGEVRAGAVVRGTEGIGGSGPELHDTEHGNGGASDGTPIALSK